MWNHKCFVRGTTYKQGSFCFKYSRLDKHWRIKWVFCFLNFDIFGRLINVPKHREIELLCQVSEYTYRQQQIPSRSPPPTHTSHPLPLLHSTQGLAQSNLCHQTVNHMISINSTFFQCLSCWFTDTFSGQDGQEKGWEGGEEECVNGRMKKGRGKDGRETE